MIGVDPVRKTSSYYTAAYIESWARRKRRRLSTDRAHLTEMGCWTLAQPSNISLTKQTRGDLHLPSFAPRIEQIKDVLHTHRTLDVTDDRADELDSMLPRDPVRPRTYASRKRSMYYYLY